MPKVKKPQKGRPIPRSRGQNSTWTSPIWITSALAAVVLAYLTWSLLAVPNQAPSAGVSSRPKLGKADRRRLGLVGRKKVVTSANVARRDAVVAAFQHAWSGYTRDAWGCDQYHPVTRGGSNLTAAGSIGYTIVDALDTLYLMRDYLPQGEYEKAEKWVTDELRFDRDGEYNTFETTIRVLGGLLSTHHLTTNSTQASESIYLTRAKELADRLLPAFDTPSGLPLTSVNFAKKVGIPDKNTNGQVSTAEVATLQLEFKYLSHLLDDDTYWNAAEKVMTVIQKGIRDGLAPVFMNPETGEFQISTISLGSRGDSYYEYLLKQYLQTGKTERALRIMYDESVASIQEHLIRESPGAKSIYTSELVPSQGESLQDAGWSLNPKQDHLVCYLAGLLLLGVTEGGGPIPPKHSAWSDTQLRDWKTGMGLLKTCIDTHDTTTGLAPEIVHFRTPKDPAWVAGFSGVPTDWYIKGGRGKNVPIDARYILRPETIESLFIAFRLTGNPKYRDQGWKIFKAIEEHCKVPTGGYAGVVNVDSVPVELDDRMETFLLSETFKYLFLLFEDSSVLPLDRVVFNTEAHIFPIFNPSIHSRFA